MSNIDRIERDKPVQIKICSELAADRRAWTATIRHIASPEKGDL